jgi:cysteine synthase
VHNLKYFTWVEQQGRTVEEINQLWYEKNFWQDTFSQVYGWDELINEFNERSGVLKNL